MINRPGKRYVGFFGRVARGVVKNIGLENVNVMGKSLVGGLVGYNANRYGKIKRIECWDNRLGYHDMRFQSWGISKIEVA